jgi:hypothetical protein
MERLCPGSNRNTPAAEYDYRITAIAQAILRADPWKEWFVLKFHHVASIVWLAHERIQEIQI